MTSKNDKQKEYRKRNKNKCTNKYEKTISGFLMRKYRNMKSRVEGIQKGKQHLYENKYLLSKQEFYSWAYTHPSFLTLWENYILSEYNRKLCPTVDRIDSKEGYTLSNMEWVTHSENSSRGAKSRWTGY